MRFASLAPRPLKAFAAVMVGALALTGCSSGEQEPSGTDGIRVVASTSVYGSLAEQVLGDRGSVTSIIDSAAQDPHSYEASARDKLTLSKANLVVMNGGGYDDFAVKIVDSLDPKPRTVLAVEDEGHGHDHGGEASESSATDTAASGTAGADDHAGHDHSAGNEHVWYELETMQEVVKDIGIALGEQDPDGAADFTQRAEGLSSTLGGLREQVATLAKQSAGKTFLMTEPVPQALLEDAGLSNATPEGLAEAIEEGDEIAPLVFKQATDLLKAGKVSVFAFNQQTADTQTQALRAAAEAGGVPVLDVTETLPAGENYQQWMESNIKNLAEALHENL